MKINKIFLSFICCAIVSSSLVCTTVSAAASGDLKDYYTDSTSGWSLKDSRSHRGTKSCKYKYASDDIKKTYSKNMEAAISLWGSKISMSETTDSGYGVVTTENNESSSAVATTSGMKFGTTTGHYRDAFTITINTAKYTDKSDSLKQKTLAHEIGHVYGLDHFSNVNKIMNPTLKATMTISSDDSAGMNTCTHAHEHSDTTKYTYQ